MVNQALECASRDKEGVMFSNMLLRHTKNNLLKIRVAYAVGRTSGKGLQGKNNEEEN